MVGQHGQESIYAIVRAGMARAIAGRISCDVVIIGCLPWAFFTATDTMPIAWPTT